MSLFFLTPGVASVVDLDNFWHFPQTILGVDVDVVCREAVGARLCEAEKRMPRRQG